LENQKGRDHLGNSGTDGRIILRWNLKKEDMRVWFRFMWLRM
jgi:hypothetical protein